MGVANLRVGGPLLSAFEASSRSDARNSQDLFSLLGAISIDRATGLALDRWGRDEDVPRYQESPSTGLVTISDTSFTKLSSKVFQGSPAPIVGSVSIDVADASLFPSTGQIYIGRGTPDYEGPLSYTSTTDNGTHWTLTLSTGTTRFHNTSESVIVALGGNRVVGPSNIVRTPQGNVANAVQFNILYSYTLPDGETAISNVQVVAQKPGLIGNVAAGAISEFSSPPFSGATVTNPSPFSNGQKTELDDDYRERIKDVKASRQAGTSLAITTAVTGITASDENKRVSSASLVKRLGAPSTLYIDDGTGYEDVSTGVAMETLVDFAIGGEQFFQTSQRPIARAFVATVNEAPYQLVAGSNLTVKVGGVSYTHNFDASKFTSISNASAYEVASSINSDPLLGFLARTSGSGTFVVIFAKADVNEDVQVVAADVGVDANAALGLPTGQSFTLQLYKNDRLLSKDGLEAILQGSSFSLWNAVSGSQTLIVAVDNTPPLTYTFVDQDFVNAKTNFSTVGKNSVDAWVDVINAKIPGLTASNDSGHVTLTSNAGPTARASINVTGGTLIAAHLFAVGSVSGQDRDYMADRNLGQIQLVTALVAGDKLTIGSTSARAFVESSDISATAAASIGKTWFIVDSEASIVATGVTGATQISASIVKLHAWGHTLQLAASTGTPFTNVEAGDWLILWDPALDPSLLGAHRVVSSAGNTMVIERRPGTAVRSGHTTTALAATGLIISKVLTTGGSCVPLSDLTSTTQFGATDTCEVFDPNTNLSSPVAPMSAARMWHTATLMGNGKVLVAGGKTHDGTALTSLEIYDPTADTWLTSAANLTTGVFNHSATLLTSGKVLLAGGDAGTGAITQFQIYDPTADTLSTAGVLVHPRARHSAVKMPNDNVLVAGGYDASSTAQATAEIFSAGALSCTATGPMARARYGMGLALIGTSPTTVIVAGNHHGAAGNTTYEIYSIAGTTWGGEVTLPNNVTFEDKHLLTLTNGHVVGLHGFDSTDNTLGAGFTYDGTTFTLLGNSSFFTDSSTKWRSRYVEIKNLASTIENRIVCVGGSTELSPEWKFQPTAGIELFDEVASTWSLPDPSLGNPVTLTSSGLVVVRSDGVVREIDVPVGTNYTSSTFASVLNANKSDPGLSGVVLGVGLVGATAIVYRTTRVRVGTNTFDKSGSVALVAQNTTAAAFGLDTGDSIPNLVGHIGSVQSNSELGTPEFLETRVVATSEGVVEQVVVNSTTAFVADALVGLKNWMGGADGTSVYDGAAYSYLRAGTNVGARTRFASAQSMTDLTRFATRTSATLPWSPMDRAYFASPFSIGPNDDLTVIVDNDVAKRYAVKLSRTLKTVGSTYSATNTFKDGDAAGSSLAVTFGLGFDFNDFAVMMPARAQAFSADSTRSMLFRYYRLGAEGSNARVRFGNPAAPSTPLSVSVDTLQDFVDVTVRIQSGAARTFPNIRATTTRISNGQLSVTGQIETDIFVANLKISSASRTSDVTHATTAMPSGVTNHGLQVADLVWVNSTDINFTSGLKTITARTDTTFDYSEIAANIGATANIGTVSRDTVAEASFLGGSAVVGDFYVVSPGVVYQISAVDVSGGWIEATSGDNGEFAPGAPGELLGNDIFRQIFAGSSQTVTAVAAAVNALAGATNSKCPVTITVLGDGTGTISQSTPDTLGLADAWYALADGINWVKTTTPPGTIAGDYTLTFKNPVTGLLSTGSDWNHETIKLVPTTAKNVVDWLNAPAVSGLFTVCTIQTADDGRRVQIASKTPGSASGVQIQGGLANSATAAVVGSTFSEGNENVSIIKTLDAQGLCANTWMRIQNESGVPLSGFFSGIALTSWTADGLMTFASPILSATPVQTKVRIEKQGAFVAISDMGMGAAFSSFFQGSLIRIAAPISPSIQGVSTANQGIFRVLRADNNGSVSSGTAWIENAAAIEENVECIVSVYPASTPVPGDKLVISDPAWGADNHGVWTLSAVGETTAGSGDMYATNNRLTVDVSSRTPVPQGASSALSTAQAGLIYPVEGTPAVFVKKILGIYPNQTDGSFTNIEWYDFILYSSIGASVGSVMTSLDKLNFPIDIAPGHDAYQYNVGLIGEANKVVQGDPSDTDTFPGIASDGSRIDISGPLVKRIKVALQLRVRSTGVTNSDVADRVRSAVATVINQSPIGQPIALSSIVAAAERVVGVFSAAILSPIYNVANDLINVQPYEKALVISLDDDIQITFSGN